MVVTFFPATLETGVIQDRVISPLMCTVQAPQSAMPHPNFVPVMFKVSRRTQSSGISGLTSTVWVFPLRVKVTAIEPPSGRALSYTNSRLSENEHNFVKPAANPQRELAGGGCAFPLPRRSRWPAPAQSEARPARRNPPAP